MEKLKMQSLDVIGSNIQKIAQLFPNCVTEHLGKDGKTELGIDFEKLQAELSNDIISEGAERYQFTWPDKRAAVRLANAPTTKTLRPCREESVDFNNTQNLYIEGDNLDVLKVLRETYLGKVKMIYIDPPYNTGNDFVYNDDYSIRNEEFGIRSGYIDEEGNQTIDPMQRNTESNGRFHTDWLNMIYPRLKVARDLLTDDGVIFISIDDNEVDNLQKICNEVFGEQNFVSNFLWKKKSTTSNVEGAEVSSLCDYTLCYRRSNVAKVKPRIKAKEERSYQYEDEEGVYRLTVIEKKDSGAYKRDSMKFPIMGYYPREGKRWQIGLYKARELEQKGRFVYDGEKILMKIYSFEDKDTTSAQPNLLDDCGSTDSAARAVNTELFNIPELFSNPKPTELLKHLTSISTNEDSIILDFFSGSATTAHAVMKLNAEDGGNRKYIMVQLPEKTDENSEAYKAGYENICEIGKERIRRAGAKINEELGVRNEELGTKLDVGFRVLKLDSSNLEDVYYTPQDFSIGSLFTENVKAERTNEDLLFQVMLDLGIELSAKIESKQIAGKKVHFVDDNYLVACFDRDVNESTITEIAKLQPIYFVMRDASAANDNVIDNFEQIFRHYSPDTVCKII